MKLLSKKKEPLGNFIVLCAQVNLKSKRKAYIGQRYRGFYREICEEIHKNLSEYIEKKSASFRETIKKRESYREISLIQRNSKRKQRKLFFITFFKIFLLILREKLKNKKMNFSLD